MNKQQTTAELELGGKTYVILPKADYLRLCGVGPRVDPWDARAPELRSDLHTGRRRTAPGRARREDQRGELA
jgi:hypothetical protein